MLSDWNLLSDEVQLALAREALVRASQSLAGQAEVLALEMEEGRLADCGGADALRLFAAIVRTTGRDGLAAVGYA